MERKTKKQKNSIVKESNALARARIVPHSVTVWDERVIAAIAALNTTSDTDFQVHKLDVRELIGKKLSTLQYNELKEAVEKLADKKFRISIGKHGVRLYPIFVMIEIDDDGVITGKINPELKPHYLELRKQFALRALPDFQKLTSIYSQKLYRFLNSWKNVSQGETTVALDELHEILQTPESFRKDFRRFRVRVLEVAHREINAVAEKSAEVKPLTFDWEPVKEGTGKTSKVVAVMFMFNVAGHRTVAMIEEFREKLKRGTQKEQCESDGGEKHISEFLPMD